MWGVGREGVNGVGVLFKLRDVIAIMFFTHWCRLVPGKVIRLCQRSALLRLFRLRFNGSLSRLFAAVFGVGRWFFGICLL